MTLTVGSLCAGVGGLDLGLGMVLDTELAWVSEIEDAPSQILARHFPGVPNLDDLTAIDWHDVPPVDVLTAGFPCPPVSFAGLRKGLDDPRWIWPHIADAVRILRPRWVFLENVDGLRSLGMAAVLADLAAQGFDIRWTSLRAADVGAPHGRRRIFILATDATHLGHERSRPARHRGNGPTNGGVPATNPNGKGSQGGQPTPGRNLFAGSGEGVHWGDYGPAIDRWSAILGRPAPAPVDERGRLSADFVEFLMGYPAGWTEGYSRSKRLKALGNAVVPQQAAAALTDLLSMQPLAAVPGTQEKGHAA